MLLVEAWHWHAAQVLTTQDVRRTVHPQVATLPPIQVRYDSSEALYLRKALNPSLAPHRAILRQSASPGERRCCVVSTKGLMAPACHLDILRVLSAALAM
jgi:hypothetical protein